MRRLLAMLLLATFGLPLAASALELSQPAETRLPACCRRTGTHHCAMNLGKLSAAPMFGYRCPNFPRPSASAPADTFAAVASPASFTLMDNPALAPSQRAETQRRISRERSRHQRGPPARLS